MTTKLFVSNRRLASRIATTALVSNNTSPPVGFTKLTVKNSSGSERPSATIGMSTVFTVSPSWKVTIVFSGRKSPGEKAVQSALTRPTETMPELPLVRRMVTVTFVSASWTAMKLVPNRIVPGANSLSKIVSSALVRPKVALPTRLDRIITTVRSPLSRASSNTGTEKVALIWPGRKVSVPLVGV